MLRASAVNEGRSRGVLLIAAVFMGAQILIPGAAARSHPLAAPCVTATAAAATDAPKAAGAATAAGVWATCTRAQAGAVSLIAPRPRPQRGWSLRSPDGSLALGHGSTGSFCRDRQCRRFQHAPVLGSAVPPRDSEAPPGPAAPEGGRAVALSTGHRSAGSPCLLRRRSSRQTLTAGQDCNLPAAGYGCGSGAVSRGDLPRAAAGARRGCR